MSIVVRMLDVAAEAVTEIRQTYGEQEMHSKQVLLMFVHRTFATSNNVIHRHTATSHAVARVQPKRANAHAVVSDCTACTARAACTAHTACTAPTVSI